MAEGIQRIFATAVSLYSAAPVHVDVKGTPEDMQRFLDMYQQFDAFAFCVDALRCTNGRCVIRRLGDWIVATYRGWEFSLSCEECQLGMRVLKSTFETRWLHEAIVKMRQDYIKHDDGCDEKCVASLDEFLTEVTTEFKDTDFCEVMKFCGKPKNGKSLGSGVKQPLLMEQ